MRKKLIIFVVVLIASTAFLQSQELHFRDGHFFKDGMLYTGTHKEYYSGGQLKSVRNIKDGLEDGKVILFFENGQISEERMYEKGLKHGIWTTWSEKGTKMAEASWRNGLKDGHWYIWDDNGVKRYEMFYRDGKKAGIWYMWDERGELVNQRDHEDQ